MQFDYSMYSRGCCDVPLVFALFILVWLIASVIGFVKKISSHKMGRRDIYYFILAFLVALPLIGMNVSRLLHGGMYLITEAETDAVEMQGEITEIEGLGQLSMPRLKSDYGYGDTNGVQFTINGVQCKASVKGDLEVGDYVTVVYLPKSGYILTIYEVDGL